MPGQTTSTPSKRTLIPSPDDSGVSIQLSELGDGIHESDKMLGFTDSSDSTETGSEKPNEVMLDMDEGESLPIIFTICFSFCSLFIYTSA